MKFLFVSVAGLFASVVAKPTASPYVVHEKRQLKNPKWAPTDTKLDGRATFTMSIGLAQRNLHKGHDFLMDISDPNSPNYGKHWTSEQVAEHFAPATESIDAVKTWLADNDIFEDRIWLSKGNNWIRFNSTIEEAEALLRTKYNVYEHSDIKKIHLGCNEYSVPAAIQAHIDFITPTIHFNTIATEPKKRRSLPKRQEAPDASLPSSSNLRPGSPFNVAWAPKIGDLAPETSPNQNSYTLSNCNSYVTPECLRALYGLPTGVSNTPNAFGIVEYTPQAYLQADLNLFYSSLAKNIPAGTGPAKNFIDGAILQTADEGFNYNGESDLDLEYAISLVYPQTVTLYQTGDIVEGASFNNFLDAIDASYCKFEGGDDPTYDSTYPDTAYGGYKGKENCGTFAATSVISTSYGYNEADLSPSYENRQCQEYMKLGLLGTTFIYSSGDYGVGGQGGQCCTKAKCAGGTYNNGGSGTFNPSFPATCPYVTAVGATQIVPGASVTAPEEACETIIYSGGGFSNVFSMPSYQSSAVAAYFKNHKPTYSSTQYNNSQHTRGFPDIAANGANYVIGLGGHLYLAYGTSASAPTVGSIITLINQKRAAAGKKPVGFINPVLYQNPSALNDITKGGNQGCGTAGFSAVPGWDPVTGLGTPNFAALEKVFMALP